MNAFWIAALVVLGLLIGLAALGAAMFKGRDDGARDEGPIIPGDDPFS